MPASKSRTVIHNAVTLTAGAADTTSGWQDISAAYGAVVDIKLTNGATGPTVAAQVKIQFAADAAGTLPVDGAGPFVGPTANSGTASWSVEIPAGVAAFRLVSGSNTGQNVTIDADYSKITAI